MNIIDDSVIYLMKIYGKINDGLLIDPRMCAG